VRTKLEVFDWLVQNRDRRIAKNPAGYLVASIRADYQTPGEYTAKAAKAAQRQAQQVLAAEVEQRRRVEQEARARAQASREAELRDRWAELNDSQREAIARRIRAGNPALRRWKSMLEPLCLAELERLIEANELIPDEAD
jgi:hypothetical protein